jgi:hypothetical protein
MRRTSAERTPARAVTRIIIINITSNIRNLRRMITDHHCVNLMTRTIIIINIIRLRMMIIEALCDEGTHLKTTVISINISSTINNISSINSIKIIITNRKALRMMTLTEAH